MVNSDNWTDKENCFVAFDKDRDGRLNFGEFRELCGALFQNKNGEEYNLDEKKLQEVFSVFEKSGDGFIDREEFDYCWKEWIKVITNPLSAFIIVDVQNDFVNEVIEVEKILTEKTAYKVISPINELLENVPFDAVFYSIDCHPENHISFYDNLHLRTLHRASPVNADEAQVYDTVVFKGPPVVMQTLWPRHCVQGTPGAELHDDLKVVENGIKIYKGFNPDVDSYSAFYDNLKLSQTELQSELKKRNITDVYVCGLCYEICVGSTAADAAELGFRVILVNDCIKAFDKYDAIRVKDNAIKNNSVIVESKDVLNMVEGKDRRPELGYKLASELKSKNQ